MTWFGIFFGVRVLVRMSKRNMIYQNFHNFMKVKKKHRTVDLGADFWFTKDFTTASRTAETKDMFSFSNRAKLTVSKNGVKN